MAASKRLLYSHEDAAELLSLSVHTIARDCRLGCIQSRRYGRRILIPKSEIERIAVEGMGAQHANGSEKVNTPSNQAGAGRAKTFRADKAL